MVIGPDADSLIFDMDGTLWDATASYAAVWNRCFEEAGLRIRTDEKELTLHMGKPIMEIVEQVTHRAGADIDKREFLSRLERIEREMMPQLGGVPYPGMREGLMRLSGNYKLFMVSNCAQGGLDNFMRYTHTAESFTDKVEYGERPVPKGDNMTYLVEKHGLAKPVYVGDTQGDCDEAHRVGIPFVFAGYGFGICEDYDMTFARFDDLVGYFMRLKEISRLWI